MAKRGEIDFAAGGCRDLLVGLELGIGLAARDSSASLGNAPAGGILRYRAARLSALEISHRPAARAAFAK